MTLNVNWYIRNVLVILVTIFICTSSWSQNAGFSKMIRDLYFGIDINTAADSLVNELKAVKSLHHSDTVVRQQGLQTSIDIKKDGMFWKETHQFTFKESPLAGLQMQSGCITVSLSCDSSQKKLTDMVWMAAFNSQSEGIKFFIKLNKLFSSVSDRQKQHFSKQEGYIAQYSTSAGTGLLKDVSICFSKSLRSKKYQIIILPFNEFSGTY